MFLPACVGGGFTARLQLVTFFIPDSFTLSPHLSPLVVFIPDSFALCLSISLSLPFQSLLLGTDLKRAALDADCTALRAALSNSRSDGAQKSALLAAAENRVTALMEELNSAERRLDELDAEVDRDGNLQPCASTVLKFK